MSTGTEDPLFEPHRRLSELVSHAGRLCDAFRCLQGTLNTWREEHSRRGHTSLLGAPTVTYEELARQHKEAADRQHETATAIDGGERQLDGFARAVGARLNNPEAFETQIRGLLRTSRDWLNNSTFWIVYLPTSSLAENAPAIYITELNRARHALSKNLLSELKEVTGTLEDLTQVQPVNAQFPRLTENQATSKN